MGRAVSPQKDEENMSKTKQRHGGSDSEQENNEGIETLRSAPKRSIVKSSDHPSIRLEGLSNRLQLRSSSGFLPSLTKRRTETVPRAVGKRTPRIPISYTLEKDTRERYLSPVKRGLSQKGIDTDDDMEHEIALALAEASQRGGVTKNSHTPNKKAKMYPPDKKGNRMRADIDLAIAKLRATDMEDVRCEPSLGSTEADNADYSGDEDTACDALQTLADLSLMMPENATDTESSVQVEEKRAGKAYVSDLKGTDPASMSKSFSLRNSKQRRSGTNDHCNTEAERKSLRSSLIRKRRQKKSPANVTKDELDASSQVIEPCNNKGIGEGNKPVGRGNRSASIRNSHEKKSVKPQDRTSSSNNIVEEDESAPSNAIIKKQVNLPTKVRSRRKIVTEKPLTIDDGKFSETLEKLLHCISSFRARRWCLFKRFYSAIDYPWFARQEFVQYLDHVGLGHVPRLTNVEWGVIRSSLGKPRRFSEQFLKEEKEKLYLYRGSVRKHYDELNTGMKEGLPMDLAWPLNVSQRVISLHPKSRDIHDGSVLTVDHCRYRIQFDQPELGVEFVKIKKMIIYAVDQALIDLTPSGKEPPEAEVKKSKLIVSVIDNAFKDSMPCEKKSPKAKEKKKPKILKTYQRRNRQGTNGGDVKSPEAEENNKVKVAAAALELASTSGEAKICLSYTPATGETANLCLPSMEDLRSKLTMSTGSLPIRFFTRGTEPAFKKSFAYYSGLGKLPVLSNEIPSEELDEIRNGTLGVLLRFCENGFLWSAKLVHELLVHQLAIGKKYELWTLCGGQAVRFSLKEFEIITGLNCEPFPDESVAVDEDPQFWERLGLEDNRELSFKMIAERIMDCKNWNRRDRIRLVYLFLVSRFLLARNPGSGIPRKIISLVLDREKFEAYPWGRVACKHLIDSVMKANLDLTHNSYTVDGFVQVLQVWAYEAIPAIGNKCGTPKKDMMEFPPLLRWKGSRKRFKFDLPQNREPVFVKYVMGNITENLWDDETEDLKVENMLSMISGTSGKAFEKHSWEDKGLFDGHEHMVEERDDQTDNTEDISLNRKRKSKDPCDSNNDALKTYFASTIEQMTETLQKQISTCVDDAFKKLKLTIEEGITTLKENFRPVEETGSQKEKEAMCSNIRGGKKSKPNLKYELKDISVDDLPTEEDTEDGQNG